MIIQSLKDYTNNQYASNRMASISKASVLHIRDTKVLVSYQTEVAAILPNGEFIKLWNGYSATTLKHINIFREFNSMKKLSGVEWSSLQVDPAAEFRY